MKSIRSVGFSLWMWESIYGHKLSFDLSEISGIANEYKGRKMRKATFNTTKTGKSTEHMFPLVQNSYVSTCSNQHKFEFCLASERWKEFQTYTFTFTLCTDANVVNEVEKSTHIQKKIEWQTFMAINVSILCWLISFLLGRAVLRFLIIIHFWTMLFLYTSIEYNFFHRIFLKSPFPNMVC